VNAGFLADRLSLLATGIGREQPSVSVGYHPCEVRSVAPSSFAGLVEIQADCPAQIPSGLDLPLSLISAETRALPVVVRK
jgi:hypothetical protein